MPGEKTLDTSLIALTPEMKAGIRILVIEDEATLGKTCVSMLTLDGYSVSLCSRGEEALTRVRRQQHDVILLDLYMSQVSGMELLAAALEAHPDTIVIMMTGNPSVSSSLEALRSGAWDYLPKPFSATQLQLLVGRASHAVVVARETRKQRMQLEQQHGNSDRITLLGHSPAFQEIVRVARQVAATDASVFIAGESGTGKELVAQFIHSHSRRSSRPLVAVNCAALPETLLESEMFGHYAGAFTGAIRDKPGLFETANGGTLFLDEITEMAPATQAKLLRVIQDGVVRRLGSNTTDAVVNVRFLAATNRDPLDAVKEGALRKDLYYRLRVVPIRVPSLRERRDDIPVLAHYFLQVYWARHRAPRSTMPTLTDAAVRALQERPWAGNVRELQNVLEHAVVMLEPGCDIRPQDLPVLDEAPTGGNGLGTDFVHDFCNEPYHVARERLIAEFERRYLNWLIGTAAAGNMSQAARIAGVDRTTLYRLMEKHGMQRDTIIRQKEDGPE